MIYIRSKDGKALMPSERGGRIGYLLRHAKAHMVSRVPFTVQLDYESTTYTQEVSLGVDAGSKHIGVSASSEKKELLVAQVELRNDVVNLLSTRRELRRTRRNRKTRYRKARFDNRKKKDDWLAPSVEQKVDSHLKVIRLVHGLLPITNITIEVAQFDAQKIKRPDIKGEEYQQGEQMCFWNVREYVFARDGHRCVHCKGKSKDPILNVHHLESRKTGGNSKKGGIRRSTIASHKIGKSRFQRFDMVRWKGKESFIFGSTNGRPVLRDIEGYKIHENASVNIKTIKFLKRLRNNILVEEKDFRKLNML